MTSSQWRKVRRDAGAAVFLAALASRALAADPFLDSVESFEPGTSAGFGAADLPEIVLGPPRGGGPIEGSIHVVSLGDGGTITVAFRDNAVCDGPGTDLLIFENAFHAGDENGAIFTEVGIVAVSADGVHFVEFAYDAETLQGLAGTHPVLSNPENGIDPTDPELAGGDPFDLAAVGLSRISHVRITDPGLAIDDLGNRLPPGNSGGFDLDAAVAVHSCDPIGPDGSVTPTPMLTLATTPTPTPIPPVGDVNHDGRVDDLDRGLIVAELFDGDGSGLADAVAGGSVRGLPGVDTNLDNTVSAADFVIDAMPPR